MKRFLILILLSPLASYGQEAAAREVGPDGSNLLWLVILFLLPVLVVIVNRLYEKRKGGNNRAKTVSKSNDVSFWVERDTMFKPSVITLVIENNSNQPVDIAPPMLTFHNYIQKKKLKVTAINGQKIYPLFLDPGRIHRIAIPTNVFYNRDKSLKYLGFLRVVVKNVNGKKIGSENIQMNKYIFF
ncbi:hypothetical protein EMN47_06490 [Prolixibacteraceae bacterium JC049]|nr:hypothetical protein [Prolixibacteraceae bacterium JC049]